MLPKRNIPASLLIELGAKAANQHHLAGGLVGATRVFDERFSRIGVLIWKDNPRLDVGPG